MESRSTAGNPLTGRKASTTELFLSRLVSGGTGVTVIALLLSRPISLPLLRSSLIRLQFSHPILRAINPTASSARSSEPSFLLISPTPSIKIDLISSDLLPPLATDSCAPISPFYAVMEHEINLNPWAEGKCAGSFFVSIYELGESGRSVLALRFHSVICDPRAGISILKKLMNLMGQGEGMMDAQEKEEGEVGLAFDDLIKKEDARKPFWVRGKNLIGYSLNTLRSSCLRFVDAGSPRKSELVRLVTDAVTTRSLLTACNVKGIKLSVALTAAAILATNASKNLRKFQSKTYSITTFVDCRKDLNPPLIEKHIGFYYSAVINTHTVKEAEGFWDVAIRCHKAYSDAKNNKKHLSDLGDFMFLMCKAMENPSLTPASSQRTSLISVIEDSLDYTSNEHSMDLGVEDFFVGLSAHGIGASISVFNTIMNGRLDSACVYPSPLHSREQMEELVKNMRTILMESCCVVDEGVGN